MIYEGEPEERERKVEEFFQARQESLLVIEWWDGEKERKRFAHVDDSWLYYRRRQREESRRRAKADRREVKRAFYVGCTVRGETYGGWLKPHGSYDDDAQLEAHMASWKRELARLHAINVNEPPFPALNLKP